MNLKHPVLDELERVFYDKFLVEHYEDCLQSRPSISSGHAHKRALIHHQNKAHYRAMLGTRDALLRQGRHAQALRLSGHLDDVWMDYAQNS